ncbi:SDR family oxidoreductase [Streptomyces sp. NPDC056296]|uniref:SDR family oxidoreductase n=1 Tax=Streptomyces sp. NPDC056296 TaxID=3345775 RepID=UPI0035DC487E
MNVSGATALVTGANRGIGRHFAAQLAERGAKVYATARRPGSIDLPGVEVLQLDITDPASIEAAAAAATDVDLLVNNAGISTGTNLLGSELDDIRREMDTHLWGTLNMVRAFAPVLAANAGGAIVNVLSALSWFSYDGSNAYAVAKAAEWSMTNGIRLELAAQNTLVTGVVLGAADTDIMAGADYDGPLTDPAAVARAALDGVEKNLIEVVVDQWSAHVKASLANDPADFYQQLLAT